MLDIWAESEEDEDDNITVCYDEDDNITVCYDEDDNVTVCYDEDDLVARLPRTSQGGVWL